MKKKATWNFGKGQFTYWDNSEASMGQTQYGTVNYLSWCRLEADRIARAEGPGVIRRDAFVKRNGSVTRVALFLGKPAAGEMDKVLCVGGGEAKTGTADYADGADKEAGR